MKQHTLNIKLNRKVQRIFACALLVLLCATLLVHISGEARADNSLNLSDESKVIDVNITYGAMSFTYIDEYTTWNPDKHEYNRTVKPTWEIEDNDITIANRGSTDIQAALSSELMVNTVQGLFKESPDGNGTENYSTEISPNNSATVYFELSGVIDTTYDYIGKILISITAK